MQLKGKKFMKNIFMKKLKRCVKDTRDKTQSI